MTEACTLSEQDRDLFSMTTDCVQKDSMAVLASYDFPPCRIAKGMHIARLFTRRGTRRFKLRLLRVMLCPK